MQIVKIAESGLGLKKKSGILYELSKNKALFLMTLPAIIFVLINNYIPMLGLVMAFKDINFAKGILGSPWNGLENFRFLFQSPDAWIITRNTIGYNLIFIILGLTIPISFAIALNEVKSAVLSKFYQATMLFPYFLSFVVVSYLVFAIFCSNGFVNSLLASFGKETVSWYSEPKYWPFILIITNTWKVTGYGTVIYLAAIAGIDGGYYEAAVIDGANKWQQIRTITIPFLKPLMIVLTVMAIGKIFYSDFGLFFQVTRNTGLLYDATKTIDVYVYNAVSTEVSLGAAAGFYQSIVGLVLVIISNFILGKVSSENKIF